jgi:hypothetical protein
MKRSKKWLISASIGILFLSAGTVWADGSFRSIKAYIGTISVTVNGNPAVTEEAISYNDAVYVPLRDLSELLGAKVGWDDKQSQITVDSIPQDRALSIDGYGEISYAELSRQNKDLQQQILLAVKLRQFSDLQSVVIGYASLIDKAEFMKDEAVSHYMEEMSAALEGLQVGWDQGDIKTYKQAWDTYMLNADQLDSVLKVKVNIE